VVLRLVIAEDSLLVREGVRRVLDRQPDLEVVATCADLPELVAAVERETPDVVVTDVRMPPTSTDEGIRAARQFRTTTPGLGVVVLSQYAEPGYANALLESGSAGRAYLLKERVSEPDQLIEAVRAVARGGSMIDPAVVDVLVRRERPVPHRAGGGEAHQRAVREARPGRRAGCQPPGQGRPAAALGA
jgi:DNA-binding NarL/FixJ family response regulator